MTTKEKIAETALDLFSVRGYEGVSIRDLAGAVGIKESSIYSHYRNKQAIFDAVVKEYTGRIEALFAPYHLTGEPGPELSEMPFMRDPERLAKLVGDMFLRFVTDDGLRKFRQMLALEQYRDPWLRQTYRSIFIEQPLAFQTALFAQMMERGLFHPGDPEAAAAQFYGPIFLMFSRYGQSAGEEYIRRALREHVLQFARVYEV